MTNEENDSTEASMNDDESGTPSLPAYDELANETMNDSDLGTPSPPPAYNKLT